jgi:hypothetical protein
MRWLALVIVLASVLPAHAQESSPAARAALAHRLYDASLAAMASGTAPASDVYDWSVRWMRADLEARVPNATGAHLDRMNALLAHVHAQVASGSARSTDETACQFYVAEARAWIAHPPAVP